MFKAVIIGLGRIAWEFDRDPLRKQVATHAAGFTKHPAFELVGACDISDEKRQAFHQLYPSPSLYADYRQAVDELKPDLVSITTPAATHDDILLFCLEKNVPVIFCEKPVTEQPTKISRIREVAKRSSSIVAVNHSRRWDVLHRKVADWISTKRYGDLKAFQLFYTAGLFNTGSHLIDLMLWYAGRPDRLTAVLDREKSDPDISAFFEYRSGVRGTMFSLDVKDYLIFELDFYFNNGRLRLKNSGKGVELFEVISSPNFSGYHELSPVPNDELGYQDVMMNAVDNLAHVLTGEEQPCSTLADGLAVVELLHQIKSSSDNRPL